jgi:hypothetical protein
MGSPSRAGPSGEVDRFGLALFSATFELNDDPAVE